jgi:hypothetical protein
MRSYADSRRASPGQQVDRPRRERLCDSRHHRHPQRDRAALAYEPQKGAAALTDSRAVAAADPAAYAYLLGLYLGDGCLTRTGSPLMLSFDARYPGIVEAAAAAIRTTIPGIATRFYRPKENSIRVIASSRLWPEAFPQHGPGRKHERPIELSRWQLKITSACPHQLLRGLIHSDGCRTINRFKTKLPSGRIASYEFIGPKC